MRHPAAEPAPRGHEAREPESELAAKRRTPLATRPRPARRLQIHSPAAVERDAFLFQPLALNVRPEAVAMGAASGGVDDTMPWHGFDERSPQSTERDTDGAGPARLPENRRHLTVRHHFPARHAPDEPIHEPLKGRAIGGDGRAPSVVAASSRMRRTRQQLSCWSAPRARSPRRRAPA